MIPKQMFFIWFGKNIPNYAYFCIDAFKKVNPDFKINLIHEEDLENSKNDDIIETKERIKDKNDILYRIYNNEWKVKNLTSEIGILTHFSDVFRVHLINKYGGIYLDCDTYPRKPFDDKILSHNCFKIINYFYNRKCSGWTDIYFMGSQKNKFEQDNCDLIKSYTYRNLDIYNKKISKKYYNSRNNFINCINDFDIDCVPKNEYILHFRTMEWKK